MYQRMLLFSGSFVCQSKRVPWNWIVLRRVHWPVAPARCSRSLSRRHRIPFYSLELCGWLVMRQKRIDVLKFTLSMATGLFAVDFDSVLWWFLWCHACCAWKNSVQIWRCSILSNLMLNAGDVKCWLSRVRPRVVLSSSVETARHCSWCRLLWQLWNRMKAVYDPAVLEAHQSIQLFFHRLAHYSFELYFECKIKRETIRLLNSYFCIGGCWSVAYFETFL